MTVFKTRQYQVHGLNASIRMRLCLDIWYTSSGTSACCSPLYPTRQAKFLGQDAIQFFLKGTPRIQPPISRAFL